MDLIIHRTCIIMYRRLTGSITVVIKLEATRMTVQRTQCPIVFVLDNNSFLQL